MPTSAPRPTTYAAVDGDLAALSHIQRDESKALNGDIHDTFSSARTITLVVLVLALLAGAALAFFIARGIKRGVQPADHPLPQPRRA